MADLLEVDDLTVRVHGDRTAFDVVRHVSFSVAAGEVVGLIGESGSGKTITSLAITRLLPDSVATIESGQIRFDGTDLLGLDEDAMRSYRGREIAMVFQDPLTSLNPLITIGAQMGEALSAHEPMRVADQRRRAVELLTAVGIASPERRVDAYPHEMSGGMRQRVMLAMAMSLKPRLLIADEPTTALDVTVQAQMLELIRELVVDTGTAVLMITHDLGLVADLADRVAVMYAGRIVEMATAQELYSTPRHPYTAGLLDSADRLDLDPDRPIQAIPGSPIDPASPIVGCAFAPRCSRRVDECSQTPLLLPVEDQSADGATASVACHRPLHRTEATDR